MLQRFARAAAFDQLAQGVGFRRRHRAFKIQIQLQARHFQQMRQQHFSLQPGRFDAFFAEKFRAFLNRFQDGHAGGDYFFSRRRKSGNARGGIQEPACLPARFE